MVGVYNSSMAMTKKQQISDLTGRVRIKLGPDRAATCAQDLLSLWEDGKLDDGLRTWEYFLDAVVTGKPISYVDRGGLHGVPMLITEPTL